LINRHSSLITSKPLTRNTALIYPLDEMEPLEPIQCWLTITNTAGGYRWIRLIPDYMVGILIRFLTAVKAPLDSLTYSSKSFWSRPYLMKTRRHRITVARYGR